MFSQVTNSPRASSPYTGAYGRSPQPGHPVPQQQGGGEFIPQQMRQNRQVQGNFYRPSFQVVYEY